MKQYIPTIISILSCILVVVSMIKIAQLEEQLNLMRNETSGRFSSLQSSISSISSNVSATLEEQANLLAASSYTVDNLDLAKRTVDITCCITPKIYQPDGTTATIVCNDKEYAMTLKEGSYQATFPIPLVESSMVEQVAFVKDGTVSTQSLQWYLSPRDEYLPYMFASFHGRSSSSNGNWFITTYDGSIDVTVEQKGGIENTVETLDLVQYVNGEEVYRESMLDLPQENTSYFGKQFNSSLNSEDPFDLTYKLDKSFETPAGGKMRLCVEMTDGTDLTYRCIIDGQTLDENGTRLEDDDFFRHECSIYDENNKLLYGSEEGYAYLFN